MRLHFSRILSVQVWRQVRERPTNERIYQQQQQQKSSLIDCLLFKFRGSYCPGSSCNRTGSSGSGSSGGCTNCKDLRREIKQLTADNTKLNKKVEQLSEKCSDAVDLRKVSKKLTAENSKLQKKIVQLSTKSSK